MMQAFERLEQEWAEWNRLDPKNMVCCSSGTAALHLALEALRLPLGSTVIVPDFAMIACARAVTLAGHDAVFMDCRPQDLLMDHRNCFLPPWLFAEDAPDRVRAFMVVHVYGRRFPVEEVAEFCNSSGIAIVEDLAEAHGVRPCPQSAAACWSFYKNKIIAGEEGGAVWFKDSEQAELARCLRCQGFTSGHDFRHVPRGHNYRMSNLHAAFILEEHNDFFKNPGALDVAERNLSMRREIESWCQEQCPIVWRMPYRNIPWVYDFRVPGMTEIQQGKIIESLRRAGIEARHGFKPLSLQEEYRDCLLARRKVLGGPGTRPEDGEWEAMKASQEVIYFPIQPGRTTREDVRRGFEVLRRAVG